MRNKKKLWIIIPLLLLSAIIYTSCQPLREFSRVPVYKGTVMQNLKPVYFDKSKKTIVIVANNEGTEIFDLMAPYYLFNATEKANVYVVAENRKPIVLLNGLFISPNKTFAELDSLKIKPDVIILPAMIKIFQNTTSPTIKWIKARVKNDTKILSICAGSLVGAAAGLYDGKPLTTHASMFVESKELFNKPLWVQNIAVTQSNNLYSTAGVSNAVEGSLTIIKELFGAETTQKVMNEIHYPYTNIKMEHQSIAITTGNKFTIANKIFLKKNRKVGVLLQDGINELSLATVLDTYHRTFPAAIETILLKGSTIISKYGLTIAPTSSMAYFKPDEIHVLLPDSLTKSDQERFKEIPIIQYIQADNQYIMNQCLQRIKQQYGPKFENITKLLLDYNLKEFCPLTNKLQ